MRKSLIAAVMPLAVLCSHAVGGNLSASVKPVLMGDNARLPKIAIITTGGTIAQKKDETGAAVPAVSGVALISAVPDLLTKANVEIYSLCNEDSSRIKPEVWLRLAKLVDKLVKRKDISGVIVTHGTDTMAEAAFFVDACTSTKKPVVFVGAMRDASDMSPDGPENIMNAMVQAVSPDAKGWGVTVTLNQFVNSAYTVRKTNTNNVETFNSGESGYLGYISTGKVIKYNRPMQDICIGLPEKLEQRVELFMSYAGCDGKAIRRAVDSGVKGLVIEAVGSGNVQENVYKAIKYAKSKGVVVVVTTCVPDGPMIPAYGGPGGGATMAKEGIILSRYLRARKARLLLMLALSNKMPEDQIAKLFQH
ncbi:asparaginase [Lentisphaerota bacterium ZTH]|nr:asparaginase [Lentisphaerota bacterium]WET07270.1 asparaginase [Lentisphaerota bacterium ZTH]